MRTKIIIAGLLLVMGAAAAYWYSHGSAKLSETDAILIGGFSNATGDSVFYGSLRESLALSLSPPPMLTIAPAVEVTKPYRLLLSPPPAPPPRYLPPQLHLHI